jgi:hypothetical protein
MVEIQELEKAIRAATRGDLAHLLLAVPGTGAQLGVRLPPEFEAAAKTLASRSQERSKESSILRAVAEMWS